MDNYEKERMAKEFGRFIREARERKGMIQAEVAEKIGVSRVYYTLIEAGNRDIYFTTAMKICKALGVDINDFVKHLK